MDDEALARQLQEEYDREAAAELLEEDVPSQLSLRNNKRNVEYEAADKRFSNGYSNLSPVDPSLEFTDPNPDIRILFLHFNEEYFYGKLSGIEVKWSPRMTLCAGLCVYEGRGGLCSVRLSQPLLKLRPRKDLIETLLHEMIHAFLFITNNDRDHDGHGPYFQKHMHRINKSTGANITIYHTFHDEVASYQQHWWRCNGPCQNRRPYFGYVKRAMNRAPSSNDTWWAEHQATCGGTYTKIKEPENYGKKKSDMKKSLHKNSEKDIPAFVGKGQTLSNGSDGDHSLFPVTGRPSSSNKANIERRKGLLFPKTNTKGKASAINNVPSTSKSIVSGGVLIPKTFLKQSSLFTSIGTSNSVSQSLQGKSHSVTTSNTSMMPSFSNQTQRRIEDVFSKTPKLKKSVSKNEQSDIFQDTAWIKSKRKDQLDHTPGQNMKNIMQRKNFHSVCEKAKNKVNIKKNTERRKRKKKYVFDELDEDDGLWDSQSGLKAQRHNTETPKEPLSVSPIKNRLKNICKIQKPESSPTSAGVKRVLEEVIQSNSDEEDTCLTEYTNIPHCQSKDQFPVQGNRLSGRPCSGERFKSFSTVGVSSMNSNVEVKKEISDYFFLQKSKTVSETKRSFGNAFPFIVINTSDEDEEEDETSGIPPTKKIKEQSVNRDLPGDSTVDEFDSVDASTTRESESNIVSSSGTGVEDSDNRVPCPVCNAQIFHENINAHLDMCLQMV